MFLDTNGGGGWGGGGAVCEILDFHIKERDHNLGHTSRWQRLKISKDKNRTTNGLALMLWARLQFSYSQTIIWKH